MFPITKQVLSNIRFKEWLFVYFTAFIECLKSAYLVKCDSDNF